MPDPTSAEDWISHKGSAAKLGLHIRSVILRTLPDIKEVMDQSVGVVAYMIGDRYQDTVVVLRQTREGWSIGFYRGRELPDPEHMLEGQGRAHAMVLVRGREMEPLRQLLLSAFEVAVKRSQGEGPETTGEAGID
jgi:hypothetical protein